VPAIEAIGNDPQELRRSLRELVAASMLPAVWREYDAHQIAESVAEVLIRMLGLEFAFVSVRWRRDPPVCVARTGDRSAPDPTPAIHSALGQWLERYPSSDIVALANPLGPGTVRAVFVPVAAGHHALIVAASGAADFPSATQRLLLEVTCAGCPSPRWR
jgi:hypothetical protein